MSIQLEEDIETKIEITEPGMWKVIFLNDNYTPMEFVVFVLTDIFGKDEMEAMAVTMSIHEKGSGIAGVYAKDIAKTRADQVKRLAEENNYPLTCKLEKE